MQKWEYSLLTTAIASGADVTTRNRTAVIFIGPDGKKKSMANQKTS